MVPFADALDYFGHYLAGPLLAAIIGGPLIAITFRYFAIGREVADHDARASELNEDLGRWVRDRNRQLETELRTLVIQAGTGAVSRHPLPQDQLPPPGAGSQLYSGALDNEAVAGMRQALHEYRDEATAKAREFSALARSENGWHEWDRKRARLAPPTLGLRGQERLDLARWRQRAHIVSPGSEVPDLTVSDDPTADEPTIAALESEAGLSWAAARERRAH